MKVMIDGKEVEVFTQEEVENKTKEASDAAAQAAIEEFKKQNPDKSDEVLRLKGDLDAKERALKDAEERAAAGNGNEAQVARLRQERDDAKKASDEAVLSIRKEFEDFKAETVAETKDEYLDNLSSGDTELRKKIELEFDNYKPTETSKAAIKERMEKAYTLATGTLPQPGALDGVLGAGARGDGGGYRPPEKKNEQTDNGKAIAKVLNITDEDRKAKEDYDKFRESTGTI